MPEVIEGSGCDFPGLIIIAILPALTLRRIRWIAVLPALTLRRTRWKVWQAGDIGGRAMSSCRTTEDSYRAFRRLRG